MKPTIADAVAALHPTVTFSINNNKIVAWDISEVKKNIPEPKQADIDAKFIELEADWTTNEYARKRRTDYPDWGAQFNKIYDDGLTKWKSEMVDPVKTKWPKDNSGPV